jgi:hypothetical protein
VVAFATAPAAADVPGGVECFNVPNCQIYPDLSNSGVWVEVPVKGQEQFGPGWQEAWQMTCLGTEPAVDGTSWAFPAGDEGDVNVYIFQDFGVPLYGFDSTTFFRAENETSVPQSYEPIIGCGPQASFPAAQAAAGTTLTRRVKTVSIHPSNDAVYRHRCHAGEHLVSAGSGVAFLKKNPPSARELRDLHVSHSISHGRLRVRVRTGPTVGDNEKVQLQIHALCRR